MLKYLLATLTFVVTLFVTLLLSALLMKETGWGIGKFLVAIITFAATRYVYVFFRKRETDKQDHIEAPAMLQTDILNFRKAFQNLDCEQYGITEVRFLERADQTSFYVGLRSTNNSLIDYSIITKALYKLYYSHVQFEFVDLNTGEGQLLNEKGIEIPLKQPAA